VVAALQRSRSRSSDQRPMDGLIPLSFPAFNLRGPFSCHVIFLSSFLLLPCVIHLPPLFGPRGPPSFSSSTRCLPHVPFPPRQPLTKLHLLHLFSRLLHLYPFCLMSSPATSLISHRSYFAPAVVAPSLRCRTPLFALASIPVLQAIQLFQVAARGVFRIPKC
jgi:hypothetical protein